MTNQIKNHRCIFRPQAGVSLIIVLIMLVIIGLTSAAAIRNATSGEKVTNNIRLQNLAQQYAEAALRYCEAELGKADDVAFPVGRMGTSLVEANVTTVTSTASALHASEGAASPILAWERSATWTGSAGAVLTATRTVLAEAQIKSADSSFRPTRLPECVVERQTLADGTTPYVVTARGFSPDYVADSTSGKTTNGSVVWLQSTVLLQ